MNKIIDLELQGITYYFIIFKNNFMRYKFQL